MNVVNVQGVPQRVVSAHMETDLYTFAAPTSLFPRFSPCCTMPGHSSTSWLSDVLSASDSALVADCIVETAAKIETVSSGILACNQLQELPCHQKISVSA